MHYFDCAVVLSRVEDNILLVVGGRYADHQQDWEHVWRHFRFALEFDLQRVKRACMPLLAKASTHIGSQSKEWQAIRAQLDKDTLFEMLLATLVVAKKPESEAA